jgi:redox-sensitive bicupin YhaK (pirin superfamily)
MTAGKGIVHGEMFPLVHKDKPNPTKFFQIWINLPKASKMVEPAFKMVSLYPSITYRPVFCSYRYSH